LEAILHRDPIESHQWDTFLDWLDKIRIGLWLGTSYLNQNPLSISPMFYIGKRIGSKDRFIIVYEINDANHKAIRWQLTESPLFACIPSCFTLQINNFLFFNASYDFLFSKRFGFPYPKQVMLYNGGSLFTDIVQGTKKLEFPLIEKKFKTGGTQLFQPMIPNNLLQSDKNDGTTDVLGMYDTQYVKSCCMDFEAGRGYIYRRDRNRLVKYPENPSIDWIPKQKFPFIEVRKQTTALAGEYLEELCRNFIKSLPHDGQPCFKKKLGPLIELHKKFIYIQ
jgi:hypothetical protein